MRRNYVAIYLMLLMIQMVICNYFRLGPYILVSVLPAMVLCIPLRHSTLSAMLIAFFTGLCVDLLAEGLIGLNTLALVPVAYTRKGLCRLIFGEELIERGNDFSIDNNGFGKVIFAVTLANALFLFIYIAADGGGAMPFVFNLIKFIISLVISVLFSLVITDVSKPDNGR